MTGSSAATNSGYSDYATIAYDASTGARLWLERYGPGGARALAVGPYGRRLFVTGSGSGSTESPGFATVAYALK